MGPTSDSDLRPDGSGSIGIAVEQAGGRKLDFRKQEKIKDWGLFKKQYLPLNISIG